MKMVNTLTFNDFNVSRLDIMIELLVNENIYIRLTLNKINYFKLKNKSFDTE